MNRISCLLQVLSLPLFVTVCLLWCDDLHAKGLHANGAGKISPILDCVFHLSSTALKYCIIIALIAIQMFLFGYVFLLLAFSIRGYVILYAPCNIVTCGKEDL